MVARDGPQDVRLRSWDRPLPAQSLPRPTLRSFLPEERSCPWPSPAHNVCRIIPNFCVTRILGAHPCVYTVVDRPVSSMALRLESSS